MTVTNKVLLAAFLLALPVSLHAQTPGDHDGQPVMDTVSLDLSVEDWVETATAKVTIAINAAVPGSEAGKIRDDMLKAVDGLVSDANWRFSSFNRSQDSSGLEHSSAELETRLKETDLGGLADKAKKESRPGLQLTVENIEFTPTLAETQAVKAKLRNEIYGQVDDELKRLAAAQPDRKFRVGTIDFTETDQPAPRPMRMARSNVMMAGAAAPEMAPEPPITVQQKQVLQAHVVLSAVAPKQ